MSNYTRVALVTGANKGIGFAIVRQLALQYPKSSLNNGPLLIYLASRDSGRGKAALDAMQSDDQLTKAKALRKDGGLADVALASLDVASSQSIEDCAAMLKSKHGSIDFVINNAGIARSGFNVDIAEETLASNYFGTLEATEKLLPLIRDDGRLVNVASMAGHLRRASPDIRSRFERSQTIAENTDLMKEFLTHVKKDSQEAAGWPSAAYAVSKAGLIGATRAIALREKANGSSVLINSCCPGYVVTDMTRGGGNKTPDQGAQTPVLLAIGDIKGQSGLFWQHEQPIKWID
ncbi:hypothetical protein EMMF5_005118 [Cystobasidiomycetes sp. EMM_F5]